jgi:hypothetical protein
MIWKMLKSPSPQTSKFQIKPDLAYWPWKPQKKNETINIVLETVSITFSFQQNPQM